MTFQPDVNVLDLQVFGPRYVDEVKNLLSKLKSSHRNCQCRNLKEFSENFTLLPNLWKYWYQTEESLENEVFACMKHKHFELEGYESVKSKIRSQGVQVENLDRHFYMKHKFYDLMISLKQNSKNIFTEMKRFGLREGEIVRDHEIFFNIWDQYSIYPVNIQQCVKIITVLEHLSNVEERSEFWFQCLKKCKNHSFIVKGCEYRLGRNPYDEEFHLEYLNYLKESDTKMALKVYSRYCRLYLNNTKMQDEYFEAICNAKLSYRLNWWIDYIQLIRMTTYDIEACNNKMSEILMTNYEIYDDLLCDDFDINMELFSDIIKNQEFSISEQVTDDTVSNDTVTIPKFFSPSTLKQQFSFRPGYINYMIDNMSPHIYFKLQKSCKYFFSILDTVYCHRMVVKRGEKPVAFETSLMLKDEDFDSIKLEMIHIGNSLEICRNNNNKALSNLLTKTPSCTIRFLTIYNQQISLKEFEFLAEQLEYILLDNVLVFNEEVEGRPLAHVEDIVQRIPTVTNLTLRNIQFSPVTAQKLAALNINKKYKNFCLTNIPATFGVAEFANFIKKYASSNSKFRIVMNFAAPIISCRNFQDVITAAINSMEEIDKPVIYFH